MIAQRIALLEELVARSLSLAGPRVSGVAPASWAQPAWFIDPAVGSDNNTGATSGSPLKTWAGLVSRLGTARPTLKQKTTFTWLSSQVDAGDPILFEPTLVQGGGYAFNGIPTQVATATIGVFTPQNTSAGTLNQITAAGQSGNFWTAHVGRTVHDVTANAQFVVIADLGSATATISAPKALPVTEFGVDTVIANGDTLQIFTLPSIYPALLSAVNFGNGTGGGTSLTQLNITGEIGCLFGTTINSIECTVNGVTIFTRAAYPSQAAAFTSCYLGPGAFGSPPFTGRGVFFGGALQQAGNNFLDGSILDGDVVIPMRIHTSGTVIIGRCYWGQTNTLDNPPTTYNILTQSTGVARLWGPAGLSLVKGSRCLITTGPAASTLLLKGTLSIDSATTAFPWVAGSHAYGAAVAITAANIDSNNGLANPQTGGMFLFG